MALTTLAVRRLYLCLAHMRASTSKMYSAEAIRLFCIAAVQLEHSWSLNVEAGTCLAKQATCVQGRKYSPATALPVILCHISCCHIEDSCGASTFMTQ